ncbi:membrane dipeptidase [Nonomuraea ferruginea]
MAATGGVICVNFFAGFLTEHEHEATLDHLLDHIEHVAGVAGIDHVGLGPDFIREVMADVMPPCEEVSYGVDVLAAIPGLEGPSGLPMVTEGLLGRGLPEKDVQKIIGGNVHRFLTGTLG